MKTLVAGVEKALRGYKAGPVMDVLRWDERFSVYEVQLLDARGRPAGYAIASDHPDMPPVLERSEKGGSLCAILRRQLINGLGARGLVATSVELHYISGFELAAKVHLQGEQVPVFVLFPTLEIVRVPADHRMRREPAKWFGKGARARALARRATPGGSYVIPGIAPIKYNQGCGSGKARRSASSGGNDCSPGCIAGCTPVAWAVLLSAYKQAGWAGTPQIWQGSRCWTTDWPSFGQPVSRCDDVNQTIWDLRRDLGTTCDGLTGGWDIHKGGAFVKRKWGLDWNFSLETWGVDYKYCRRIVAAGQPFILSANADWNALPRNRKDAGHSVVCYGYDDNQLLRIALGWGYDFPDKWIYHSAVRDHSAMFIAARKGQPLRLRRQRRSSGAG